MDIPFDRFKKITTESSITNNDNATKTVNDINAPFSFLEWLIQSNLDLGAPENYIQQYSSYLQNWSSTTTKKTDTEKDLVIETYKTLLKQITLKYTTIEEKRYLSNVDFNNPADLDVVIPFYATRLKDIVIFLSKKREEVKYQKIKFNLFGTNMGVKQLIFNLILQLTTTEEFLLDQIIEKPDIADLGNDLSIEIEELYDIDSSYYDINPCDTDDRLSSVDYDPLVFVNFEQAVIQLSNDLGTLVQTNSAFDIFTSDDTALSILSGSSDVDIDNFPESEFFDYVKSKDNLKINIQKQFIENIQGSDSYYLSAGPAFINDEGKTVVSYVTGQNTTSSNEILNYFNREYPTIAHVPNKSSLFSKRLLGGYFTPQNLGISNYYSIKPKFNIIESNIEPNTLQEYPDPNKYGTKRAKFVNHTEDIQWVKADKGNDEKSGEIVNSSNLQKFYNYQSNTETNKFSNAGISRIDDSTDFWTEDQDWKNADVYKLNRSNFFDLSARQRELLVNNGSLFKWSTDIYGNTYGLFKDIQPLRQASLSALYNQEETINISYDCTPLDNGTFLDPITLTNLEISLSADGSTFLPLPEVEKISFGAYFTPDFCKLADGDIVWDCRVFDSEQAPNDFTTDPSVIEVTANPYNGWNLSPTLSTWDAQFFTTKVDCYNTAPAIIQYATVETSLLSTASRGDDYTTLLQEYHSPATTKSTIYNQNNNIYGDLYVRNINNTIIQPASSALSKIFEKYKVDGNDYTEYYSYLINTELNNYLLDIDAVYDTLIFRTPNYVLFEKINYDYTTNEYKSNDKSVYVYNHNNEWRNYGYTGVSDSITKTIKPFFNERENKIYTGCIMVSGEYTDQGIYTGDEPIIYPEIYEYNVDTLNLKKIFPTTSTDLTDFYLPTDALVSNETILRVKEVDTPVLTYNEIIDKYYLVNTCTLSSDMQNDIFSLCKTEFTFENNEFKSNGSLLYIPSVSGQNADAIKEESETISLDISDTTTTIDNVSGYNFNLTIDPAGLSGTSYGFLKFIYNFNDGTDTQTVERSVTDENALVTLDNIDDVTDPRDVSVTHTYFFTGSASETVQAHVSAIDYNFNTTLFTIDIQRIPYTISSAFESMKLLDAKSYIHNEQENTIITLESQDPQYITHVALSGKQLNVNAFNY